METFLQEVQTSRDFLLMETEAGEGQRAQRRRLATRSDPRVTVRLSVIWCLAAVFPFECKVSPTGSCV